jgi:hypothetical protein
MVQRLMHGAYILRVQTRRHRFHALAFTGQQQSSAVVSIPVKWGTDSGEVGQRQSKATLAMAMISEVPHLSQEVRGS